MIIEYKVFFNLITRGTYNSKYIKQHRLITLHITQKNTDFCWEVDETINHSAVDNWNKP
jgi:hypothetical protein